MILNSLPKSPAEPIGEVPSGKGFQVVVVSGKVLLSPDDVIKPPKCLMRVSRQPTLRFVVGVRKFRGASHN